MKILRCKKCGNATFVLKDSGVAMICCGEEMKELNPLTRDGALEKHVPVYELDGKIVNITIGSVLHPMEENHYIEWIILETNLHTYVKQLTYTDEPKATFVLTEDEKILNVYEYCNLHGFWKSE